MIRPDLQPIAESLRDRLARDAVRGWLTTFGADGLLALCERIVEELNEELDLITPNNVIDEAFREGQRDGFDAGYALGCSDGKEEAQAAIEKALKS